jgi:Ca-activated chloride channel family protein
MTYKRFLLTFWVGLLLTGLAAPAKADGVLFSNGVFRQPSMSHIEVTIKNKIATTTLEQTFRNTLDSQMSAIYIAPVPQGATLTSFAELIDGKWIEATIKGSDEAKTAFDEAANKGQDAALTSASVNAPPGIDPTITFQTSLVLPAQSERSVRLTYTEVLNGEVGLTRYTYPLSNSNMTDEPIGDLLVKVNIAETDEIRAIYSPSHGSDVEVSRPDQSDASVVYRKQNVTPTQNFELVYTQSSEKFGLNLASYREKSSDDGYFVLIAAPQLDVKKDEVVQKDFVFVLDCSGSMDGQKFIQAKAALKRILDSLNPGDRFNIITFSSGVQPYSESLVPLDRRNDAKQWVTDFPIGGGTNINAAMLAGLQTVDQSSNRPHIVVFLTDGQATDGVTATSDILRNVRESIRPQSRVYSIGIGDVNQALLDSLSQENRGNSLFVTPTQGLETVLANYYAAINNPVLVDLALDFGGVEVYDLYPNPIPDMFLGGQVVITGRYKGSGPTNVTLTGNINGEKHISTYKDIKFLSDPAEAKAYNYVPRLWAQRKVDSLVRQLSIGGPDKKLIDEVKDLGLRYNLVTPYTSFVVTQKDANKTTGGATGLPKTGLPFLYVDEYRTMNTGLMLAGGLLMMVGLIGLVVGRKQRHG